LTCATPNQNRSLWPTSPPATLSIKATGHNALLRVTELGYAPISW